MTFKYALTFYSLLFLSIAHADNLQIISGNYVSQSPLESGALFLLSSDQGKHWTFPNQILAKEMISIDATNCYQTICIGVGEKLFKRSLRTPVILRSANNGATWLTITDIINSPNAAYSYLTDLKCRTKICVAIGVAETPHTQYPFLLTTRDLGLRWNGIDKLGFSYSSAEMTGLSYSSKGFTVVGYFKSKSAMYDYPFALTSMDGSRWLAGQIAGLPTGQETRLSRVKCLNDSCVAAGFYLDANGSPLPVIIQSKDGGLTWNRGIVTTTLPKDEAASLTMVDCNPSFCVAVGFLTSRHQKYATTPYLLVSSDQGQTWQSIDSGIPSSTDPFISSLYCSSGSCLVAGFNFLNQKTIEPLLLQITQAANNHWQINQITSLNDSFTTAQINALDCDQDGLCFVGGFGILNGTKTYSPLVARSVDGGATWVVIPAENFSHLPANATDYITAISHNKVE